MAYNGLKDAVSKLMPQVQLRSRGVASASLFNRLA